MEKITIIGATDKYMQKRVYEDDFNGKKLIHVRNFYRKDKESGEYAHTAKGITFTKDEIPTLIEALKKFIK